MSEFAALTYKELAERLAHYLSSALVSAQYSMTDETMHDALGLCDQVTRHKAAPAPPAGDVEVLEVYGYQCRQSAQEKFFLNEYPHYWQHIPLVRQADAMERITRLTAERDGLLAEVEFLMKRASALKEERDTLQSELNKARELARDARFNECLACADDAEALGAYDVAAHLREWAAKKRIAHNADESCGQDAEAANICQRVGCSHEICGHDAEAAKGGA